MDDNAPGGRKDAKSQSPVKRINFQFCTFNANTLAIWRDDHA
jgi:hypothetical protein